ncbi:AraC family transcriptional regulator [Paenibacillus agaridevorans]|uniref:AraC family transcriptional regulator n=1 Tax=Paenibacillus agaridevorans TaxID=171404 RepID=A0A2R5EVS4_9BACL|nr:helix-turn-helix domain-containing protein [Paenibacillus agaridevorans]GBG10802.1 AraC family transcriptional regulator [Paenibacillus agaridevorans]
MKLSLPLLASLKRHPTYMKLIFYFVSANVLVLAVSFALLNWQSSKTLLEEIGDHSESLLANGARNTARLMEWSLEFSFSSSNDSILKVYALSDRYSDLETYEVWSRLTDIKNANPSIHSVYLINDYTNTIVDSRLGLNDAESFYDQDIIERLRDPNTADHSVLIPRTLSSPLAGQEAKEVMTIVRFYEKGSSISAFVLNVDTHDLMTLLQNNSNYANRSITVLNDRDETVYSSIPLNREQVAELRSHGSKGASGWKLFQPRKQEEQLMVYASSSIKGIQDWSFIETIPKSAILGKIAVLRNTSLILFLVLFLASLTVIVLISKRVYSPIQELISRVMRQHQAEKPGEGYSANELDYLSNVFTAQHQRIHVLTEQSRHHKTLGRERFLRDFLGDIYHSLEEIRSQFQEWGIDLPEDQLSVAIYRIDRFSEFSDTYPEKDRRLLRFAMSNIIQESLQSSRHKPQTVDMGNDHVAVVLSAPLSDEFAGKLQVSQQLIRQYLSIGTTVAWGRMLPSLTDMHEIYMETYELTQERFQFGHGTIIVKEWLADAPGELYHLPVDKERQMAQALSKGNADTVLETIRSAVARMRELPYFESKMSLIILFMDIRRLMQEHAGQPLSSSWGLTSIETQITQLETMENVASWIESLTSRTLEDIAAARGLSKNVALIEQAHRFIDERLTDPNLSATMLADHLGLSVNYFRGLYKMETNQSITDTISEKRLDCICRELIASDAAIEQIIHNFGFSSLNTFYSIFKKVYGMTPAQYRRMNRQ